MNFNLISPTTNGNDYTINFKDPITIPANSKLSLNWVELKRQGSIVFDDDQTIRFDSIATLPTLKPSDNTANTITFTATIKKGLYTLTELQAEITKQMSASLVLPNFNIGTTVDGTIVERYTSVTSLGKNIRQNDGKVGVVLSENFLADSELEELQLSTANQHDAQSAADLFYVTNNNNGAYDNYANLDLHFDFFRGNCKNDTSNFNGYALFDSNVTIDTLVGKIGFGLVGAEYTDGIAPPPTRTTGNNPPLLDAGSGVPLTYIWVDCDKAGGDLVVYMAENATGESVDTWTNPNQQITKMAPVLRLPVSTTFNTTDTYRLLFGMEIKTTETQTPELVWKIASYEGREYKELYNSDTARRNLQFDMCVSSSVTYDNATAINSQIPFTFQMSATNQNEGWEEVCMTAIDKSLDGTGGAFPITIVREYKLTISEELGKVLNLAVENKEAVISELYPNACNDEAKIINAELDFNWRSHNYSIFINLPTNNYKNIEKQRDGGFKKSILGNIPSPFTTGTVIENAGSDAGEVIAIYQPYQPIVSSLKNNELQTNNLSIKIVNMDNETPATDIDRSVINFTISDEK
tara:strand:+ start:9438 stop:11177 length:1740 start_codon:yes stop_codon:yes gene_type:complete